MGGEQSIGVSNLLSAEALVRSLLSRGIDTFFVSPGYRDAPIIARLVAAKNARVYSAFDERAAAYQALGYAKAVGRPAVLICTSGTAVANYLPAVIEACQTQVPMIVVSTDRPTRLRYTNANQVIDQTGILGKFVKRSIALAEMGPSFSPTAVASYVQKAIDWTASWPYGVVHINLPFDEPLEPVEDEQFNSYLNSSGLPDYFKAGEFCEYQLISPAVSTNDLNRFEALCKQAKKPFLIIGSMSDEKDRNRVDALLSKVNIPFYVDVSSSLKNHFQGLSDPRNESARAWWDHYDPDFIIHLGARLVTRSFEKVLSAKHASIVKQVTVSLEDQVIDINHAGVWHVQGSPRDVCDLISESFSNLSLQEHSHLETKQAVSCKWTQKWQDTASVIWEQLPDNFDLFLGNSTTIRLFDEALDQKQLTPTRRVFCNRGVSGIEGLVSTGLGVHIGSNSPVCVVLGDVSLMHDLNSLLNLRLTNSRMIVIVLNDGKGGIFDHLPIGKHANICHPFISTPHGFSFQGVAEMARVSYEIVDSTEQLSKVLGSLNEDGLPSLIELKTPL